MSRAVLTSPQIFNSRCSERSDKDAGADWTLTCGPGPKVQYYAVCTGLITSYKRGSRCFHKMDSCVEDQNMQSEQCDPVSQLHSSFSSAVQTALYNAATIGRQLCVCVMNRHASLECSNCCYATTEKRVRRRALCWSLHTLRLEHFDFLRAAALWVRGRVSEPPNT